MTLYDTVDNIKKGVSLIEVKNHLDTSVLYLIYYCQYVHVEKSTFFIKPHSLT